MRNYRIESHTEIIGAHNYSAKNAREAVNKFFEWIDSEGINYDKEAIYAVDVETEMDKILRDYAMDEDSRSIYSPDSDVED